jgi:mersacidin/lichenicidin family type 2 lantibiotic
MDSNRKKIGSNVILAASAVTGLMGQANSLHLSPEMIVRAWKSPAFRQTLSKEQLAALPQSPAGLAVLPVAGPSLQDELARSTCDHGCPCSTASMDCSGTAHIDCSNTTHIDCSNTTAIGCCNTGCIGCS